MPTLTPVDIADARRLPIYRPRAHALTRLHALTSTSGLLWLAAASLMLRLWAAYALPLTADEAYAVVVSRSHSLSYYDHPPMVFALARGMADLFGTESPFLMRLPFIVLGTVSIFLMYDIARRSYGSRAGFWAAVVFTCGPIFVSFGQGLIVPDGPLYFGLLLCLWCVLPVLLGNDRSAWRWPAAGAALGFALLSKYHAVLFGCAAVAAIVTYKPWRSEFTKPGIWVALSLSFVASLPVLIWNCEHHWASFAFQTGRAYQPTSLLTHVSGLLSVLLGQAVYILPGVWLCAHKMIIRGVGPEAGASDRLFSVLAILPIVVFDTIGLIGHHALAHWSMSGFLFALPMVGRELALAEAQGRTVSQRRLWAGGVIVATTVALFTLQAGTGFLSSGALFGLRMPNTDWRNLDWSAASQAIPDDHSFILLSDWVSAGQAGLALGENHPILVEGDPHHFQFIPHASQKTGYYVVPIGLTQRPTAAVSLPAGYVQIGKPIWVLQRQAANAAFWIEIVPCSGS